MIDIVIATYNPGSFLLEQVESIVKQTGYDLIENIIISDDNSQECRYLTDVIKLSDKILIVKNTSGKSGAKENFSFGISTCKSEYIMTCDQDDVWLPNKVLDSYNEIKKLDNDKPCLVATDVSIVNEKLEVIHESFLHYRRSKLPRDLEIDRIIYKNIFPGCTMIFNRALIEMALPIPKSAIMHDWWLISFAKFSGTVSYLTKPTMLYRQHSNNCIGAHKGSAFKALFRRRFRQNISLLKSQVESVKAHNLELYKTLNNLGIDVSEESQLRNFLFPKSFIGQLKAIGSLMRLGYIKAVLYLWFCDAK